MKNSASFYPIRRIFRKFTLLSILLIGGCSKTTVLIDPSTGENGNQGSSSGTNLVTFNASVESLNLTKSMTPIQTGTQATLYAYNASSGTLITQGSYQSSSLGSLTGLNDYQMYLPDNTYNFYGVSANSSQRAPSFNNGLSEPLSNGVDYLWWGVSGETVNTSRFNLPIVFTHSAAQIVFEVNEGNGITIDSLLSITTTAPTQGAQMDLQTGVIPPATSNQVGFVNSMGINGLLAQSILLPINNWNYMAFSLTAIINGETLARTFGGQIPIPNGKLQAGNSYWFKIVLNANSIETPSVSITGWTIVDETGKPIYPGQLFP